MRFRQLCCNLLARTPGIGKFRRAFSVLVYEKHCPERISSLDLARNDERSLGVSFVLMAQAFGKAWAMRTSSPSNWVGTVVVTMGPEASPILRLSPSGPTFSPIAGSEITGKVWYNGLHPQLTDEVMKCPVYGRADFCRSEGAG